ncbi:helix-turn-helix domain-containing protein [Rhodococcus sp. 24CO]|uniref:helix-turn-helix domain-containing protein n=1 Tax=Rhodococcus sp. 24CO TaxID=3117460 RepID=UPI003D33F049
MLHAERGISRRELTEALGVHHQTLDYRERGEYSPSFHSVKPLPRLGSATETA